MNARNSTHAVSSGHAVSKSGRGRPRASLACAACRIRKTKCDFMKSEDGSCTFCQSAGIECVNNHKDRRKRDDPTKVLAHLSNRLASLESALHQRLLPEMPSMTNSNNVERTSPYNSTSPRNLSLTGLHPTTAPATTTGYLPNYDQGVAQEEGDWNQMVQSPMDHPLISDISVSDGTYLNHEEISTTLEWQLNDNSEHALDQLLPDFANFHEATVALEENTTGYLATVHHGLTRQEYHFSALECVPNDAKVLGEKALLPIDLDSHHIRSSMLDQFWRSSEVWLPVVNRDLFVKHKRLGNRSQYYSKFLENTMLANASTFSTSKRIQSSGRDYAERAKKEIFRQLQTPTVSTIQGLMLLGYFEARSGESNLGWTLCALIAAVLGMAFRLLFDLGLHQDPPLCLGNGNRAQNDEIYSIQRLVLVAFCYDSEFSGITGRRRTLPVSIVEKIVEKVKARVETEPEDRDFYLWTELSMRTAQLQDLLNDADILTDKVAEQLSEVLIGLQDWYQKLPQDLSWKETEVPILRPSFHALHAKVYAVHIAIHQISTYLRSTSCQEPTELDRGLVIFPDLVPHVEALESAIQIATIIEVLEDTNGTEYLVPTLPCCMYLAGKALIGNFSSPASLQSTNQAVKAEKALSTILRVMQANIRTYPIVYRILWLLMESLMGLPVAERLEEHGVKVEYPVPAM